MCKIWREWYILNTHIVGMDLSWMSAAGSGRIWQVDIPKNRIFSSECITYEEVH